MTREIKFRAWDGYIMYTPSEKVSDSGIFTKDIPYLRRYLDCDVDVSFVQMQYTGLKDKNGEEIFEGDIVLYSEIVVSSKPQNIGRKEYAEIKWNPENYRIDLYVHRGNFFEELDKTVSFMEVVGNIYEDAHLLDEEQEQ